MARKQRGFKAAEFDRVAGTAPLEPQNIAIARAVLVEGRTQAAVARETGRRRQRISQIVAAMREAINGAVPPGWRTDTATLPTADWSKVRALERAARSTLKKAKQSPS